MYKALYIIIVAFLVSCGGSAPKVEDATAQAKTNTAATTAQKPKQRVNPTKVQNPTVRKHPAAQQNVNRPKQNTQVKSASVNKTQTPGNYKAKNKGWMVNLDKAFAESQKTGKPIMANFTGSDWCGWCKKLDKSVFHQPAFEKWAKKNVVLLELDFPRRFRLPDDIAQQNRGLQQTFGVRGYPTIWLFDMGKDDAGKYTINALGKTGYMKTVGEFTQTMDKYMSARG